MELNMKKMVNLRIALSLLFVIAVAGCKAPPLITDDTLETSTVDGVALVHRHAVVPPGQFSPINEAYRALYPTSVMTRPDFGGKVVTSLETGGTYTVLGMVENNWLAIGELPQQAEAPAEGQKTDDATAIASPAAAQLTGYVPFRALVKSDLYDQTLKADQPKRRVRSARKKTCVSVDGDSKACQNENSGTWIIN